MHSLFTEACVWKSCGQFKLTRQIKAIVFLRPRIIHRFFRLRMFAVNKFCRLRFRKTRSTQMFSRHTLRLLEIGNILMENSTAYHIGQITGAIIIVLLIISIFVFFIVALIKAFKTRRKGWIITASLFSIPFLLFLILFIIGMVIGFKQGINRSAEIAAARRGEPSHLLTAAMTSVSGSALPYQISLPWLSSWAKNDSHAPFDYLFSYHDAYVSVIAEGIGVGTPERICDISQKI
jgi:hypothetical protein